MSLLWTKFRYLNGIGRIGLTRSGLVYELFFTNLPQSAFTAADVVALYLHRGAFEPALADEDQEQDPDRWCSHSASGQQAWQIISQWVWNLRLELGHQLEPTPMRTTEFAPAIAEVSENEASTFGYASPEAGLPWKAGHFSGRDFVPQSDGSLRCPAGKSLHPNEERREADGTLRVLFAAKIRDCRGCHLREQCQWHGTTTKKPRRVSLLLHPLGIGTAPVLWKDWSRRHSRRVAIQLCRSQRVEMQVEEASGADPPVSSVILSRAQRAHYRLSWKERLARNARPPGASRVRIKLFGIPEDFAAFLGLASAQYGFRCRCVPSLGQVCFSEWCLPACFPRFSSFPALVTFHPFASASSSQHTVLLCGVPIQQTG